MGQFHVFMRSPSMLRFWCLSPKDPAQCSAIASLCTHCSGWQLSLWHHCIVWHFIEHKHWNLMRPRCPMPWVHAFVMVCQLTRGLASKQLNAIMDLFPACRLAVWSIIVYEKGNWKQLKAIPHKTLNNKAVAYPLWLALYVAMIGYDGVCLSSIGTFTRCYATMTKLLFVFDN